MSSLITNVKRRLSTNARLLSVVFGVLLVLAMLEPGLWFPLLLGGIFILMIAGASRPRPRTRQLRAMIEERQDRPWPRKPMRRVLQALRFPAFILDRDSIVRFANNSGNEFFGETDLGIPLSFKFRMPEIRELVQVAISQNQFQSTKFQETSGNGRWLEVEVLPIPRSTATEDRSKFFLLTFRDLTEAHLAEQMRTDFIANASHELRTPLASVRGFIETLKGPARNDAKAFDQFLDVMQEQAERMSRLIDDLLSLSQLEMKAHRHPETETDIAMALQQVKELLNHIAKQQESTITINSDPSGCDGCVIANHDELVQLFQNLMENALKYGGKGVEVNVSFSGSTDEGGNWFVRTIVEDNGPGIAEHHIPRLTERFYRVEEGKTAQSKGTGLGLAIVKHIVNRHRGELSVESELDRGTRFVVDIPACEQD